MVISVLLARRRAPAGAQGRDGWSCRLVVGGGWVEDLRDLGDARPREAADFGVGADRGLAIREIDAEGTVPSDIAMRPLDVRADLIDGLVRSAGRAPEFD